MSFLRSEDIVVFPSVRRKSDYVVQSRLMSEQTSVLLTKNIVNKTSYVITSDYVDEDPFEFVLDGYYFKVSQAGILSEIIGRDPNTPILYASLNGEGEGVRFELYGDVEGVIYAEYEGVNFTVTNPPEDALPLIIYDSNSDEYSIPEASKVKFTGPSLQIDVIDGGEI